jgi:hypothetical protein
MIKINDKPLLQIDDKGKLFLLRLAMIIGIVFLAYNHSDGWGWLVFLTFITFEG